ncbi:MAG: aminotransferase class V-fold PLP-dependent enzyme [Planctomycetota bacterium]
MTTSSTRIAGPSALASHWSLDTEFDFLNHGSFGATPKVVLAQQDRLREEMEAQPVRFLARELEPLMDQARAGLGAFVDADPDDLAFVANATAGINTVTRSLQLEEGDEVVTCDQEYNASRNALIFAAERAGATVRHVQIPFPIEGPEVIVERFLAACNERTKLVMFDHITSQTGLLYPAAELTEKIQALGIDVMIDGAHAPGQVAVDLEAIGAAYYTANCHKWMCAPKGAAFLHVRKDKQDGIRPLTISHGANSPRADRSFFRVEADWLGTDDPTRWLCIPDSIRFLSELFPGGIDELQQRNHDLVLQGRKLLCDALEVDIPCPESMIGSLASVPLPDGHPEDVGPPPMFLDRLNVRLFEEHRIEVPVVMWPKKPHRVLRISAQAYNRIEQYERLASLLPDLLRS